MPSWEDISYDLQAIRDLLARAEHQSARDDLIDRAAALLSSFYMSLSPDLRRLVDQFARGPVTLDQLTPGELEWLRAENVIDAAELSAAEAGFKARAEQVAEQLPQAAEAAAKEISEDSPVAQAARAMADALRQIDASKLGPVGVLILLFWLIFYHMNMSEIAGATLFYMVLSDYLKKQD